MKTINFRPVGIKIDPKKNKGIQQVKAGEEVIIKHEPLEVNGRKYPKCLNIYNKKENICGVVAEGKDDPRSDQETILYLIKNDINFVATFKKLFIEETKYIRRITDASIEITYEEKKEEIRYLEYSFIDNPVKDDTRYATCSNCLKENVASKLRVITQFGASYILSCECGKKNWLTNTQVYNHNDQIPNPKFGKLESF